MVMMDDDKDLEALFAEAQSTPRMVSDDLMARVLSDAATVQADLLSSNKAEPALIAPKASFWDTVGGWTGALGFAACAVAGIYFGYLATDLFTMSSGAAGLGFDGGLYGDISILYEGV